MFSKHEVAAKDSKYYTEDELADLSKSALISKILELQSEIQNAKENVEKRTSNKPKKQPRKFNFSASHQRRILLKIMYLGWDYQGFAVQDNTVNTIEDHLFNALTKTCLIEKRETSNYNRCGRTDKGVSSAGQVISITVRSRFPFEDQYIQKNLDSELPYCKMLNHFLPKDIRAICWLPVPIDKLSYSARFDCDRRSYKYYFPKANLNLELMQESCDYLVGKHDFRNLAKLDLSKTKNYVREIFSAKILPTSEMDTEKISSYYYLLIEASGFLWHQIRLIFSILLLVGQGKEEPVIMKELLDIEKYPTRPQFLMSAGFPLNLNECSYDIEKETEWIYDPHLGSTINHLHSIWLKHNTAAKMTVDFISNLEKVYDSNCHRLYNMTIKDLKANGYTSELLPERYKQDKYVKILKRPVCKLKADCNEIIEKKTKEEI